MKERRRHRAPVTIRRDTHEGDDPRDVNPCPPGTEEWKVCRQRFIDWASSPELVLTITPPLDGVLRTLHRLGSSESPDDTTVTVPLGPGTSGFVGVEASHLLSGMTADTKRARDLRRQTPEIRVTARLTYTHSRAACERHCHEGKWEFRFVQEDEERTASVDERITVNVSQDVTEGYTARSRQPGGQPPTAAKPMVPEVEKALKKVEELCARATALVWDAQQLEQFHKACDKGTACGAGFTIELWSERKR